MFSLDHFNYSLPQENIAHSPAHPRDTSKLLVLSRSTGEIQHKHFYDLPDLLTANDVLVRNNTKVLPARIFGTKPTGGKCEILLIRQLEHGTNTCSWECMTKPGLKIGQTVSFEGSDVQATCMEITDFTRTLEFNQPIQEFYISLDKIGHTPIPPYIRWDIHDEKELREIYQTTYAKITGSVAAPTAGLHFTPEIDEKLKQKGVQIEEVTLHVGLGTFLPLQDEQLKTGKLHHEFYEVTPKVAERLNEAKKQGKRIISVGTTTTRVLETCANENGELIPGSGDTDLMIQPGDTFKFIQAMITNFHLPKSSLLMLVSAFVSIPNTTHEFTTFEHTTVGKAYAEAIANSYRFYSFGDAMLIQ